MPTSTNAAQKLNAQWYNAMITGLQLNDQQFQLLQGPATMPYNSADLWAMFNVVPPPTFNNFYAPNPINNFTAIYNLILSSLVTGNDWDFQNCMGDYYEQWMTYFQANAPNPFNASTVSYIFNNWAMINAPSQAGCVSALTKAMINPVMYANKIFADANGSYAWNQNIDALQNALNGGTSKSFTLDTNTASSDTSHIWANISASDAFDFFSLGGNASYDDLSSKLISAGLNINANYKKVITFFAGPYSQVNPNNPALNAYRPWYANSVLSLAYLTKDNTVWNNTKPVTWDKAFGSTGILQRMTTALVVADGIDITITSSANFSTDEQATIRIAATGGIWPLFSANGSSAQYTHVTFDDDGRMTCAISSPLGNPQVLGVLQSPLSVMF